MADRNVRPSNPGYVVVKDRSSGKMNKKATKQLSANNRQSAKLAREMAGIDTPRLTRDTKLTMPTAASKKRKTQARVERSTAKAVLQRRHQERDESQ